MKIHAPQSAFKLTWFHALLLSVVVNILFAMLFAEMILAN